MTLGNKISSLFLNAYLFSWDILLVLYNLVTPKLAVGHVTPKGQPGEGGKWPEYIPPKEGDSRCACPCVNAMANHGILPRDGRNVTFTELTHTVRTTYNFAPTFCRLVGDVMAGLLNKDYHKDTLDLEEISLHNGIEHDASLTREDMFHQADQGTPYLPFIHALLASATEKDAEGNPLLTISDIAKFSAKRRADAKATNPDFSLSLSHKMFGSSNSSGLLTIFGGRVKDLETLLVEERFPEGWESRVLARKGMTIGTLNKTVFKLEGLTAKEGEVYTKQVHEEEAETDKV